MTFALILAPCCSLGMVLVRTELGQFVLVHQQALAQVQAQAQAQNNMSPRPVTPTTGTSFSVTAPQVRLCSGWLEPFVVVHYWLHHTTLLLMWKKRNEKVVLFEYIKVDFVDFISFYFDRDLGLFPDHLIFKRNTVQVSCEMLK